MILYVESNFLLEIALRQEEHTSCKALLDKARAKALNITIPSFCVGEVNESYVRRAKKPDQLYQNLTAEIRELSRSRPYSRFGEETTELMALMVRSIEDEKNRLDTALNEILNAAELISLSASTIRTAIQYQTEYGLSPQDLIVFASVVEHLATAPQRSRCFVTKNSKDFSDPEIDDLLQHYDCKRLFKFADGRGYVSSKLP